jgi:hypothetical protein
VLVGGIARQLVVGGRLNNDLSKSLLILTKLFSELR